MDGRTTACVMCVCVLACDRLRALACGHVCPDVQHNIVECNLTTDAIKNEITNYKLIMDKLSVGWMDDSWMNGHLDG